MQVVVIPRPLLPLLVCQPAFFLFLFLAMIVVPFQGLVDVVRSGGGSVVVGWGIGCGGGGSVAA